MHAGSSSSGLVFASAVATPARSTAGARGALAPTPTQPIPLTPPDGSASYTPAIAVDPAGNYCVTWVDERDGNREIYFLKVSPAGAPLVGPLNVSQTAGASIDPDISVDGAGTAHICWQEGVSNGEGSILLSRVNAQGVEVLNNLTVSSSFCRYPSVTATAQGETWLGFRRREALGLYPIYSAKVSVAGAELCEIRRADNSVVELDNSVSIDWNTAGQVVATFHDIYNFQEFAGLQVWSGTCAGGCASGCGSRCQWFSSNALEHTSITSPLPNLLWLVFENDPGTGRRIYSLTGCNTAMLVSDTQGPAVNPSISSPEGIHRALVVWEDRSASISEIRIRNADLATPSEPISIGLGNSSLPDVAAKDSTHWAAVWQNDRAGVPEIYFAGSEVPAIPPYEIVSVVSDSSLYQCGVDTALLDVVVMSHWGASGALALSLELEHHSGDITVGTQSFSLLPGGQQTLHFNWPVEAHDRFREFDAHATLADAGQPVLERIFVDLIGTTPLSDVVLEEARGQLASCAPQGVPCALAVAGLIPVAGTPATLASIVIDGCEVLSGWQQQDLCRLGVGLFGLTLDAVDILLDGVSVSSFLSLGLADVVISGAIATTQCALDLLDPCAAFAVEGAITDRMDQLAQDVSATWDSLGRSYSNQVFVGGSARLSILAGPAATTPDSVGMTDCWMFRLPVSDISWAHVGPAPTGFGAPTPNAHASILARIEGVAGSGSTVLILHRDASGVVRRLRYEPVAWAASGVAWIPLSDTSSSYPMWIDHDGDGVIDITLYPNGAVPPGLGPRGRLTLGAPRPNPGRHRFDLPITVPHPGGWVEARVVDVQGREVRRLAAAWYPPGAHFLRWDGRDAASGTPPSGTYWLVVSSRGETRSARITTLH